VGRESLTSLCSCTRKFVEQASTCIEAAGMSHDSAASVRSNKRKGGRVTERTTELRRNRCDAVNNIDTNSPVKSASQSRISLLVICE